MLFIRSSNTTDEYHMQCQGVALCWYRVLCSAPRENSRNMDKHCCLYICQKYSAYTSLSAHKEMYLFVDIYVYIFLYTHILHKFKKTF